MWLFCFNNDKIHTDITIHLEFPYIQLLGKAWIVYVDIDIAANRPRLALQLEVCALSQRTWQAGAVGQLVSNCGIQEAIEVVTEAYVDGCITRIDCNMN